MAMNNSNQRNEAMERLLWELTTAAHGTNAYPSIRCLLRNLVPRSDTKECCLSILEGYYRDLRQTQQFPEFLVDGVRIENRMDYWKSQLEPDNDDGAVSGISNNDAVSGNSSNDPVSSLSDSDSGSSLHRLHGEGILDHPHDYKCFGLLNWLNWLFFP